MTAQDRINDLLRHFPTMLDRWRGGHARMWELTVSHKSLTIRVERPGVHGNLHVVCAAPTHLCGPVDWDDCEIEIAVGSRDTFVVRDRRAGLEVHAGKVEVMENCKPVFTPPEFGRSPAG